MNKIRETLSDVPYSMHYRADQVQKAIDEEEVRGESVKALAVTIQLGGAVRAVLSQLLTVQFWLLAVQFQLYKCV